ncbi:16S rRNA (guanine(966)-N(2))-methyltransferase RsmD [Hydrogenimonas thermophila]|uniref:16S rRNA (guanine(966)-N(2))-methyltransferase RsmD n=1 Tax=Hydrogenimonas thermophila TaxID=223786 RepID=UPI00293718BC|nr:16S rRNA (guanine(966)-N(2))-methyltransferase RsmD [Hydrogenimonas thermophila]WOE68921.1 16S rRNA (guanine(966)-N(2))-methyltransferase RsmD [Hydrogenimonas thermophila]WOE71428.1 16S rRNA (guanine(966)-N(2))-methyltransferase RsmD [Hydrogenimonas thermophila]
MAKTTELTTKIIGGKYKGKKLLLPSKTVTRSSKSRLKESLFNTLQFDILDQNFVEVFGGSGSVGLEAISRGASRAYFIEQNSESYKTLQSNCRLVDSTRCETYLADAFIQLPKIVETLLKEDKKAYIYIDPPFAIREGHEDIYQKVIRMIEDIPQEVVIKIIIEHMTQVDFPERIGSFSLEKRKKFGKSSLSYYSSN